MANTNSGFSISIKAVDQTAGALDGINKRLARLNAPAERFNKALAKFGDTSGLSRVSESVRDLGKGAADAFRSLDQMASPLAAITSVGSLAGIAALTRKWAEFGNTIGQTSYRLNMPVEKLGSLRGAMRLAGGSASDLDSGLAGLDERLRGAAFGRDPAAIQAFQSLHIGFGDAEHGARKASDALGDIAESLQGKTPGAQHRILEQLGLNDSFLPLLKNGRKGLEDFQKQAEQTGGVMTGQMVQNATEMNKAWQKLGLDFEGVGNRIVDSWSGTVTKVLENSSKWIEGNKKLTDNIAQIGAGIMALGMLKPAAWVMRMVGLGAVVEAAPVLAPAAAIAAGAVIGSNYETPETQAQREQLRRDQGSGLGPTSMVPQDEYGGGTTPNMSTPGGWWWRHAPSWLGGGPPTADLSMTPAKRAFLATLAGPESHGQYDIKNGGSRFSDYSQFPEGVGPGGTSTASGRYQFISKTWHDEQSKLGLNDFSPENQDKAAWDLAWGTYKQKTGRDLEGDVKSGGHNAEIASSLRDIWPSLPGGSQSQETQPQFDGALAKNMGSAGGNVHVEVTLKNAPPGTTAKVASSGAVTAPPARVETSLPMVN